MINVPLAHAPRSISGCSTAPTPARVLVGCPDARPPAYQAVIALARAGLLGSFATSYYHAGSGRFNALARKIAPGRISRLERYLSRRHHEAIPGTRVRSHPEIDLALMLENRAPDPSRRRLAHWRTQHFDKSLTRLLRAIQPEAALIFSDVGSEHALPYCRQSGTAALLSMVHGDVREEREVLAREAERAPDFFPIYLADGKLDREELTWLHERRLRDLDLADHILVPSEHIAGQIIRHGTPRSRVSIVPYAADLQRFCPDPGKRHEAHSCTFLFTGGITQRKGIKYLLEAWRKIRRPGWRLQLLGGMPANKAPLEPYRDEVEWLGRVGHQDVPGLMARADVFVFPSLFEGSAVVTYEALACGLPSIVTAAAGSVVRDGVEGLLVPSGEIEPLARAMESLGEDPDRRDEMARAARERAESFGWPRYHDAIRDAVTNLINGGSHVMNTTES